MDKLVPKHGEITQTECVREHDPEEVIWA